ncbi:lipase family protein [Nocardia pseudobrasiliensis]|uniref:Triacylglycerol lipase n=1 Tax=Nocardia pseudobrasiliensis TaxID=45979 RepID=A0A370I6S4_9NOCA|nr:lipase family protein [Nocardia pseudobrasiliensis]RDI66409.1 triacylglycerol lipase [Nocardia pseudobrasiliensis]
MSNSRPRKRCATWALAVAAAAVTVTQVAAIGTAGADPNDNGQGNYPIFPALPFPVPPEVPGYDHGLLGHFPGRDPAFYNPPADIVASKQPGEIIAAREMVPSFFAVLPLDVEAWQISYRSTNTRGEPIPAVTTVMKPRGSSPTNLVSYQLPEDSIAAHCAPSYMVQQASIPPNYTGHFNMGTEMLVPIYAITQGYAVAMPDYEGPNGAFAAGPLEGQLTLDGIKAAENFGPMLLRRGYDTAVGLLGNSGGAIATGWAAEMKDRYAPELNIVGAAEGGTPADLTTMVDLANSQLAAGLIFNGVLGVAREYPQLDDYFQRHMNPLGKAMIGPQSNMCMAWNTSFMFPFLNIKGLFDVPDVVREPEPAAVLAKTKMGQSVPRFPMFIYHSNPDWVAPVGSVNELVHTYCRDGEGRVEYNRTHANEGYTLFWTAQPRVFSWLKDRFDGKPVADHCICNDVAGIALEGQAKADFYDMVGPEAARLTEAMYEEAARQAPK